MWRQLGTLFLRLTWGKALILVLLVAVAFLVSSGIARRSSRSDLFEYIGLLVMVIGVFMGYLVGAVFLKDLIISRTASMACRIGSVVGALALSPVAAPVGIVTGTLGGGIGEVAGKFLGVGGAGIFPGIYLAIVLAIVVVEFFGGLAGCIIGRILQIAVHHLR